MHMDRGGNLSQRVYSQEGSVLFRLEYALLHISSCSVPPYQRRAGMP